jgi:hypothetical protein
VTKHARELSKERSHIHSSVQHPVGQVGDRRVDTRRAQPRAGRVGVQHAHDGAFTQPAAHTSLGCIGARRIARRCVRVERDCMHAREACGLNAEEAQAAARVEHDVAGGWRE